MKKRTVLSLTTAAVILAAYVPNEPILANTPSSEVIKETKVGSIIKQNNIKYKVLTVEGNIGLLYSLKLVKMENHSRFLQKSQ